MDQSAAEKTRGSPERYEAIETAPGPPKRVWRSPNRSSRNQSYLLSSKVWCPCGGREAAASQEGGQHGLCPAARGRFHVLGTRQLSRRDGGSDGDRLLLRQWRHLQRHAEQYCNRCGSSSNHTSTLEYAGRARNAISEAVRRNRLCRCTRCCRHGVHGMGAQQATRRGAHAGPLAARALGAVAEQPALELLPQPERRLATMVLHRRRVGLLRRPAMPNRERYTPTAAL